MEFQEKGTEKKMLSPNSSRYNKRSIYTKNKYDLLSSNDEEEYNTNNNITKNRKHIKLLPIIITD